MTAPNQVTGVYADQADGNISITWQPVATPTPALTGYVVQRSTTGLSGSFSTLASPTSAETQYIDTTATLGTMYWYQVAANNGAIGTYSTPVQMVPAPPAEMSLFELRLRAQQTADRVNSQFVVNSEWNSFIRLACYELYDLLITSYEDLFAQDYVFINTNGTTQNYPIPDGVTNYLGGTYPNSSGAPAPAFYKLAGMDLGINTSNNAWVTLLRFDFIERNKYVYPNSTSTIYGVYNMRYRLMGNNINIIPTPAGNQQLRMWYSPKLKALLADTDYTSIGYSGWLRYVIVRAAKYALDKEEGSDTSPLAQELAQLKLRIEQTAQNRDIGEPDTISPTRSDPEFNSGWGGGQQGGW